MSHSRNVLGITQYKSRTVAISETVRRTVRIILVYHYRRVTRPTERGCATTGPHYSITNTTECTEYWVRRGRNSYKYSYCTRTKVIAYKYEYRNSMYRKYSVLVPGTQYYYGLSMLAVAVLGYYLYSDSFWATSTILLHCFAIYAYSYEYGKKK